MSCSIPFNRSPSRRSAIVRLAVLCAALLLIGSLALMGGGLNRAAAHGAQAPVEIVGSDDTPAPRPPRPRINPVSPDDDTVVRPDAATGEGVSGLPASGIGITNPADDDVQRWTTIAIAALALNAVVLSGVAIWSLRRRRI